MKIYTRTGDGGDTGLFGSERVPKDDARVSAYGTVDEANAALGSARAELARSASLRVGESASTWDDLDADLAALQSLLFDLGSDLATPVGARQRGSIRPIDAADVLAVEALIDRYDAELPPLRQFVLPGGSALSAALHVARAVLRRAERDAVSAARSHALNPEALRLLNRLSDLLFTFARLANVRAGVPEVPWRSRAADRG